jgi:hypothetical protein
MTILSVCFCAPDFAEIPAAGTNKLLCPKVNRLSLSMRFITVCFNGRNQRRRKTTFANGFGFVPVLLADNRLKIALNDDLRGFVAIYNTLLFQIVIGK